ncbi:MAG: hypothetical protein H7A00_11315 [Hahellaceae bacterium]|nr:hypothetical protein [Hahellaceae bacterium]
MTRSFLVLLLFWMPSLLMAEALGAGSYEPRNLDEVRAQYNLLVELRNADDISESIFEARSEHLSEIAEQHFGAHLDGLEIQQLVPAQKIDWFGTALYVISIVLVLVLCVPLFFKLERPVKLLWRKFYRMCMSHLWFRQTLAGARWLIRSYWDGLLGISLMALLSYTGGEYMVLLVAVLGGVLISASFMTRAGGKGEARHVRWIALILMIFWGLLAKAYQHHLIGFMSVGALIASLGFFISMAPGLITVGVSQALPRVIVRLMLVSLFICVFSWLIFYTAYLPNAEALRNGLGVFEEGLCSLPALAYFVCLGGLSFYVYRGQPLKRMGCEALAFSSGLAVLLLAFMYGIGSMFWIGLLFMIWNLVDKYYEWVYRQVDFVWFGLITAGVLGGSGYLIKANMPLILQSVAFLSL